MRAHFGDAWTEAVRNLPGITNAWHLDETAGTRCADYIRGRRHGTQVNAPNLGRPSLTLNDGGHSVAFTAASAQYITFPSLNVPTAAITLGIWISTANLSDTGIIGQQDGTKGSMLYGRNSDQIDFQVNTTELIYDTTNVVNNGLPHFLCGTYDGTNANAYFDAVLVAGPTAVTAPITVPAKPFLIAQYGTPFGTNWTGVAQEGFLCNQDIGPGNVRALYLAALS